MKISKKTTKGIDGGLPGYTVYQTRFKSEPRMFSKVIIEGDRYVKGKGMYMKIEDGQIYIDHSKEDFSECSIKLKIENGLAKVKIPSSYTSGILSFKIRGKSFAKGLLKAILN